MATATIERNGTSVEIPLVDAGSGQPLVSVGWGKPNAELQNTGSLNPISQDFWSGNTQYTLSGFFHGSSAYSKAISLFDLIKSNSDGNSLTLNIDTPEFESDILVCPGAGQDQSLSLGYNPGGRNYVSVDLSLTRISQTIGGADQPANTPTDSGSGPIQISYRGTTVDLTEGVTVTRSTGRPGSVVRRVPNSRYPNYIDKHKTAPEAFELSMQFTSNAVSQLNDLVDIFNTRLGRTTLTLDFNGKFGMGAFQTVPNGSNALRHVRQAGEAGTQVIPTINLRRAQTVG